VYEATSGCYTRRPDWHSVRNIELSSLQPKRIVGDVNNLGYGGKRKKSSIPSLLTVASDIPASGATSSLFQPGLVVTEVWKVDLIDFCKVRQPFSEVN
jgi:hypothetical protein